MMNDETMGGGAADVDALHLRINDALAAVGELASVLRAIAAQSEETEIRQLAEQALESPTVAAVLDPPAGNVSAAGKQ
jgi:uncharacterized protein with von Willebrand factor type A (vWA) domain